MTKRLLLALLAAFALASHASAATWSCSTPVEVSGIGACQFSFVTGDGGGASNLMTTFRIKSGEALVCVQAAASVAAQLVYFPLGPASASVFTNGVPQGGANGNASWNGTGGPASTQNACGWFGPGFYALSVSTACGAGTCTMSLQAGGTN